MYKIMVAVDGSEHSERAVAEAALIAEALKAELTLMTVAGDQVFSGKVYQHFTAEERERFVKSLKEEAEGKLETLAEPLRARGLQVKKLAVLDRMAPAESICSLAESQEYNLVVLGSHGLAGMKEYLLGSVSNKVAHCIKGNVLIVK